VGAGNLRSVEFAKSYQEVTRLVEDRPDEELNREWLEEQLRKLIYRLEVGRELLPEELLRMLSEASAYFRPVVGCPTNEELFRDLYHEEMPTWGSMTSLARIYYGGLHRINVVLFEAYLGLLYVESGSPQGRVVGIKSKKDHALAALVAMIEGLMILDSRLGYMSANDKVVLREFISDHRELFRRN